MRSHHCPYCFMRYVEGRGGFGTSPQAGDFIVCGRCGHVLVFRWRAGSESLKLECLMIGEFQGLSMGVRERLARMGMMAGQAAQGWEAPRWN